MQEGKWLYQIGKNTMGVIVSLIPLALFGGVAVWLHLTKHPAVIIAGLFTALALTVTLVGVYRLIFVKFLVSETGFFHQTRPGNGRFYRYNQLQNAWSSQGTGQTGVTGLYFHYQLKGKPPVRVYCTPIDLEAIHYMLQRFQAYQHSRESTAQEHEPEQYEISGRTNGRSYLVLAVVIFALMLIIELPMVLRSLAIHQYSLAILSGAGTVAMLGVIVYLAVRYRCFQVKIDDRGFYLRTTPFNGKYYRYTDIKDCREIRRVYRHRGTRGGSTTRHYAFLFSFTDQSGVNRKFFFQKDVFNHEIQVLKARIAAANHRDTQPPLAAEEPTRIWKTTQPQPRTRTAQAQPRTPQSQARAAQSQSRSTQSQPRARTTAPTRSTIPPLPVLLLGIVLLGVGLYLLSPHISAALRLKPQNTSWIQTTATVVNVSTQDDAYNIIYSYTVNGASYQNSTTSDTPLQLGDTISVYYNPASPQFSRDSMGGDTGETVPMSKTLFGSLSTALGLGCVIVVAWSLWKPTTAPVKARGDSDRTTR